ncbi:MAG: hypothetical protein V8T87_10565 [Victivallales bacterium]
MLRSNFPMGRQAGQLYSGHEPAVTSNPGLIANIVTIIDYLQEKKVK